MDGSFVDQLAKWIDPGVREFHVGDQRRVAFRQNDGSYAAADLDYPTPLGVPLTVHSLEGVVEYLSDVVHREVRDAKRGGMYVEVANPTFVSVRIGSAVDDWARRQLLVSAIPFLPDPNLSGPIEEFLITLRTCFAPTPDRDKLVNLLSRVRDENVREATDDSLSQVVTVRKGVQVVSNETVPQIVELAPYRAFQEIAQVTSQYIVRLKSGDENTAVFARLIEIEDNLWRAVAVKEIKRWLREKIAGLPEGRRVPVIG